GRCLLLGLLYCGDCERRMTSKGSTWARGRGEGGSREKGFTVSYGCPNKLQNGVPCHHHSFKAEWVERAALKAFRENVLTPENEKAVLARVISRQQQAAADQGPDESRLAELNNLITAGRKKLGKAVLSNLAHDAAEEELAELCRERDAVAARLRAAQAAREQ